MAWLERAVKASSCKGMEYPVESSAAFLFFFFLTIEREAGDKDEKVSRA